METLTILGVLFLFLLGYRREDALRHRFAQRPHLRRAGSALLFLLLSLLLVLHFDLSPLYREPLGIDSSVFLYIGRAMCHGAVPYRDLFDHKGIVLYFLEYLGCLLGGGNVRGVWVVELLNMGATLFLFYKTARLFSSSRALSCAVAYLVLAVNRGVFDGGNYCEEYALPWIALSLYIVLRFYSDGVYRKRDIAALGFGFAYVFLLRVNMAALWAVFLVAVTVTFIREKRFAELFRCALLFLLGCVLLFVPVLLYLLATGSLQYMLRYYFIYNFSYTGSAPRSGYFYLFFTCLNYLRICSFFVLFSLFFRRTDRRLLLNLAALALAFLSEGIGGRSYVHYILIFLPFLVVPLSVSLSPLMERMREVESPPLGKAATAAVSVLAALAILFYPAYHYYFVVRNPAQTDELSTYLSTVPDPSDDVLLLGNSGYLYLKYGLSTNNRFFYQQPAMDVGTMLYEDFISELEKKPSDLILDMTVDDSGRPENYRRVLRFLDQACADGQYTMEQHSNFQVYVKKG